MSKNEKELYRQVYGDAAYHEMNKTRRNRSIRNTSTVTFMDGKHRQSKHKKSWMDDEDWGDWD